MLNGSQPKQYTTAINARIGGAGHHVTTRQTPLALKVTGITMLIGLVYWAVVIWRQKGKAWNLKEPILDEAAHVEVSVKMS